MFKKFITLIFALFLMTSVTNAEKMMVFEESDNVEKTADKLMAGEDVPVMDLLKFPTPSKARIYSNDTYVSEKAYTQLDSVEKDIYNGVDSKYASTMNGINNIETTAYIPLSPGYDYNTSEGRNSIAAEFTAYNNEKLGYNLTRALYALCAYDKPQYFWFDITKTSVGMSASYSDYDSETGNFKVTFTIKYNSNKYSDYYFAGYTDITEVQAEYDAMYAKVDEIIKTIPSNATDFQKLLIINKWLLDNNSYGNTSSDFATIAPSALLYGTDTDTDKHPVCEGYAEAFKVICDKIGIDCVCGEAFADTDNDGILDDGHKWNLVKMDGKWYYYDGTWNDSGNSAYLYNRVRQFLIGRESMSAIDNTQTHKYYHDLDKAQLGFENLTPDNNDYLTNRGIVGLTSLDFYKDNNINYRDIAQSMKNLMNNNLTVDINKDGSKDLMDVVDFMKLMYK